MQITLTTIDKAKNSTKLPTTSQTDVLIMGLLKDQTNIINPVFMINNANSSNISNTIAKYNYLHCPQFNRYYHILNWEYDDGVWLAYCHVDTLATWKNDIGRSNQLIARSAIVGEVDDALIMGKLEPHYTRRSLTNIFADSISRNGSTFSNNIGNGVYIVTMAGKPDLSGGAGQLIQNTYLMTQADFIAFRNELSSTQYTGIDPNIDDITTNVTKLLINPFQYIIRSFYLPISYNTLYPNGLTRGRIKYGWYTLTATAYIVSDPVINIMLYNGTIPIHPNLADLPMYRAARWSSYTIEYPFLGKIVIPNERLINQEKIYIYVTLDVFSGDVTVCATPFNVVGGTETAGIPFVIAQQNWSIPIPITSYLRDPYAATDNAAKVGGGVADVLKDVFTLNISGAIDDINGMFKTATGMSANINAANVQMSGSCGSFIGLTFPRNGFVLTYVTPSNQSNPCIGFATCEYGKVSDYAIHSGTPYIIMCEHPVIHSFTSQPVKPLNDEYEEIMQYMEKGFFYE